MTAALNFFCASRLSKKTQQKNKKVRCKERNQGTKQNGVQGEKGNQAQDRRRGRVRDAQDEASQKTKEAKAREPRLAITEDEFKQMEGRIYEDATSGGCPKLRCVVGITKSRKSLLVVRVPTRSGATEGAGPGSVSTTVVIAKQFLEAKKKDEAKETEKAIFETTDRIRLGGKTYMAIRSAPDKWQAIWDAD